MQVFPCSWHSRTRASRAWPSATGTERPEHSLEQHSPSGTRVMVQSESVRHSAACASPPASRDGAAPAGAATEGAPLSDGGEAASSGRGSAERAQPRHSNSEHSSREGRMAGIVSQVSRYFESASSRAIVRGAPIITAAMSAVLPLAS